MICERSVSLEVELNYKYSYCMKELFIKWNQCTLSDVVSAYENTINLIIKSTHDLNLIKNCYIDLAFVFMTLFDDNVITTISPNFRWNHLSQSSKKGNSAAKASEAAFAALCLALRCVNCIREQILLPGHKCIKEMSSAFVKQV